MIRVVILLFTFSFSISLYTQSVVYYVNPQTGNDQHDGSAQIPFATLEKAVMQANNLTGQGNITIKLSPGLYTLKDKLIVNPIRQLSDSTRFTIQARVMPSDTQWTMEKVPVIQSISEDNSSTQFNHSTGILVAENHVTIEGIKFLGNPSPVVPYYYPISREDQTLDDLIIRECLFVGNKESARIQGAVWAHGTRIDISNCIFYECRNAILLFNNVTGFNISQNIITQSYESALWLGNEIDSFSFRENVVANNQNFLVMPAESKYSSAFKKSIISGNASYVGSWSREKQGIIEISNPGIIEEEIYRDNKIEVVENFGVHFPDNHFHTSGDQESVPVQSGLLKHMRK